MKCVALYIQRSVRCKTVLAVNITAKGVIRAVTRHSSLVLKSSPRSPEKLLGVVSIIRLGKIIE